MRILHAQHVGEAQRFACASTAHAALELRDRMKKLLVRIQTLRMCCSLGTNVRSYTRW